jgi:hypothetical protein
MTAPTPATAASPRQGVCAHSLLRYHGLQTWKCGECDRVLGYEDVPELLCALLAARRENETLRDALDELLWLRDALDELLWHGCVTGDCPHQEANACVRSLIDAIDAAALAATQEGK